MSRGSPNIPGYARVRVDGRTKYIRILREDGEFVVGKRVTKEGVDWERANKTGVTQEMVVCGPEDVKARLVLDTHYAELVEEAEPEA